MKAQIVGGLVLFDDNGVQIGSTPIDITVIPTPIPPDPIPPIPPTPPVTTVGKYLVLSDDGEGASWNLANSASLGTPWSKPGGDWLDSKGLPNGPDAYATLMLSSGAGPIDIPGLGPMVQAMLTLGRDTIFVGGDGAMWMTARTHTTPPVLMVNGVTCPCLAAITISQGSPNTPVLPSLAPNTTDQYLIQGPGICLRFDLRTITGPITDASLKLIRTYDYGSPQPTLQINILAMPRVITDPAIDIDNSATGLCAQYPTIEAMTAAEPAGLLVSDDVPSDAIAMTQAFYSAAPGGGPISSGGTEYIKDPDFGFTWVRCWGENQCRLVSGWRALQGLTGGQRDNAPWRRPYDATKALGYDEIWCGYFLRIGADWKVAATQGSKLPGLDGGYEIGANSGVFVVTDPPPASGTTFEARMWMTLPSKANPGIYRPAVYRYDPDWPNQGNQGGGALFPNLVPFYLKEEQAYWLELHLIRNTYNADGTANKDGLYEFWIDGILIAHYPGRLMTNQLCAQIQSMWMDIYHGGETVLAGRAHIDFARPTLATKMVGPPKGWKVATPVPTPIPDPIPTPTPTPIPGDLGPDLAMLVASMPNNSWAEYFSANITETLVVGNVGDTGNMLPYSNNLSWDPNLKCAYAAGGDHGTGQLRFVRYTDATRAWDLINVDVLGLGNHGYYHTTVDQKTGDVWHWSGLYISRWDGTTYTSWPIVDGMGQVISTAIVYWTGPLNGVGAGGALILLNPNIGRVNVFDPAMNNGVGGWVYSTDAGPAIPGWNRGAYSSSGIYLTAKNCAVFSNGSTGPQRSWRMNPDFTFAPMPDSPESITLGVPGCSQAEEPVSGNLLMVADPTPGVSSGGYNGHTWELDPTGTGTWKQLANCPPNMRAMPYANGIMGQCSTHGCVLYATANYGVTAKAQTFVYKR